MKLKFKNIIKSTPTAILLDMLWVFIAYGLCRAAFLFENWSTFSESLTWSSLTHLWLGGLRFDASAIGYTNALFILLFLLPVHKLRLSPLYRKITKWVYITVNALCVVINLADAVFFSFRMQRSTMATFREFNGEGNLMQIGVTELVSHWYFVILAALIIWALWKLYRFPALPERPLKRFYIVDSLTLIIVGFATFCCMRGNIFFLSATRPISINYAFSYANTPTEAGLVLNTPFSIIRTVGQTTIPTPDYFATEAELDAVYSPLQIPSDSATVRNKNVVILIVESFATEFIGALNRDLDGGKYKGYTPFADEMLDSCMWFDQMVSNTFFSIDAPPAVLASIPRADRPFVVSPHSVNHINSIASLLKTRGYSSAFFHGADNESLGIHAFTRQAGFDEYFGKTDFLADKRFGGMNDFDGYWGIWDEPFLQYFATKLSEMKQPFVASVFTLSSHHPFKVPEQYKDRFTDEGIYPLHKCIRYTDYALRRFFETARKQPWFANTIFVITADHTSSKRTHEEYKNSRGDTMIPILFYDPSGELPRGKQPGIIQQTDIMPTLLGYLGYDRPYIAFGKDMLSTPAEDSWAFQWNSVPYYIKGDYFMIFENGKVKALYNYRTDRLLKHDLKGTGLPQEKDMETRVKAIIQSYLERMNADNVTVKQ